MQKIISTQFNTILIPQVSAWVTANKKHNQIGRIQSIDKSSIMPIATVLWFKDKTVENIAVCELKCGFQLGMAVQDVPTSKTQRALGEGIVIHKRTLGNREQVLVDFPERGEKIWIPFQNLKPIKDIEHRFRNSQNGPVGNAERFRLRTLARAISLWNENTGAFSRLEIDPLPHQIHLVHHILASGNLNWLIADDVGLGKTIEVGMLLSALIRRQIFKRILLITPAGLVKQWKEELHHKFSLSDFLIYGEDFDITESRHWKLYDHVIGSVDRFKSEEHLSKLLEAENWDIIIFDEAHNLSRSLEGMTYRSTHRFKLAAKLRQYTDAMILLSATPHQGKQDRFQALLELIRPEMKSKIDKLSYNPEILQDMVIRNQKSQVTDSAGNFIFLGKTTNMIEVSENALARTFDAALISYLKKGFDVAKRLDNPRGRAIGFVMTIYRKLSASSVAAIKQALENRLHRLIESERNINSSTYEEKDMRFYGEYEEDIDTTNNEFFSGEVSIIKDLIHYADEIMKNDLKMSTFVNDFLSKIFTLNSKEKIVIFTEYKATQRYIESTLKQHYPNNSISLIHGGMSFEERAQSIAHFEDEGLFLISTEAGGEGINLHRNCHIMVNFDLPWNPMRIVQRVGRLYRYGQKKKVIVFNLFNPHTLDGNIIKLLYNRIEQVVQDLSGVGTEYKPGLEAEILGELSDVLDIENILTDSLNENLTRTKQHIEEALIKAKEAVKKQRELLEFAYGFNPDETKDEFKITKAHLQSFIKGMSEQLEIEMLEETHSGAVMRIRLPESIADTLGLRARIRKITVDRIFASNRSDIEMMDFESQLFRHLITKATDYSFSGHVAAVSGLSGKSIFTAILRWQNSQGNRMRQEFAAFLIQNSGKIKYNPDEISQWLLHKNPDSNTSFAKEETHDMIKNIYNAIDSRFIEVNNKYLHPENRQLTSAAQCSNN